MDSQEPQTDRDLQWRAFCYANGDMSDADCRAFELELGADEATREALTAALRLVDCIVETEPSEPAVTIVRRERPRAKHVLAWLASTAGAALLVAGSWAIWSASQNPAETERLAGLWWESRVESDNALSDPSLVSFSDDTLAANGDGMLAALSPSAEAELESTVDWMSVALAEMAESESADSNASDPDA